MSDRALLLQILVVYLAAAATPGPNVALIVQTAGVSRRAGVAAAWGVVTAGAMLASVATFGLGTLLARPPWVLIMRLSCGGYLVYLGVRMILDAPSPPAASGGPAEPRLWASYQRGLLTNVMNPKAAVFFGNVLTGMLPATEPAPLRGAVVAMIVACSAIWHLTVALSFSTRAVQHRYRRAKTTIGRVLGVVLVAFGLRLLLTLQLNASAA